MASRFVYSMIAVASLGLAGSFNGCTCNGEAQLGKSAPQTPEPPPPAPPPPAPVASAPPPAPAPAPAPKPIMAVGKAKIEGNRVKIPGELEFDVDKATIKQTPQSKEILDTLVEFMKQNPQVTKLRIEGHTDNSGKPDHNAKLSQERADAVTAWLAEHGVDKTRLVAQGFGQDHPLVPNDTVDHKAMNRRTEFHVAEIDGKPQTQEPQGGAASTMPSTTGTAGATGTATGTTSTAAPATTTTEEKKETKGEKGGPKKPETKAPIKK